jgi:translation initiation factor 2B subunit (eIF-2B alpha/beta/delta family)
MGQITSAWIKERKIEIEGEIKRLEGALEMLKIVDEQITAPTQEALSLDDLQTAIGADSVEVIPLKKGGADV